jgi:hypothetical protein
MCYAGCCALMLPVYGYVCVCVFVCPVALCIHLCAYVASLSLTQTCIYTQTHIQPWTRA